MDEARGERGRHAVDHAAVALAVAAGDERGALGQRVLADLAFEGELIERRLYVDFYIMFACGRLWLNDWPEGGILIT